jgi:hypothetical protein
MEHKIATACLMNSRRIHQTLLDLANQKVVSTDRHMAVLAALKMLQSDYQGVGVKQICDDLSNRPNLELEALARRIHPVLCSLRLQKWLKDSGQQQYMAESAGPRGALVRRILLDDDATELRIDKPFSDLWN